MAERHNLERKDQLQEEQKQKRRKEKIDGDDGKMGWSQRKK